MNIRLTKKDLHNHFDYIVRGGYCEFQYLTKYAPKSRELGYACGVYGWNWTAYSITASNGQEIVICTGYRDMTGKRLKGLEKYEKKAKEINGSYYSKYKCDYKKWQRAFDKLATAFADYIVANYEEA